MKRNDKFPIIRDLICDMYHADEREITLDSHIDDYDSDLTCLFIHLEYMFEIEIDDKEILLGDKKISTLIDYIESKLMHRFSENDEKIIKIALSKDYRFLGWEQLAIRCETIESYNEVRRIEYIKWKNRNERDRD